MAEFSHIQGELPTLDTGSEQIVEPAFREKIKKLFGESFGYDPQMTTYIHATSRELAEKIITDGLLIGAGLNSTAVSLGRNFEANLRQLRFTHNHNPVVVFIRIPIMHQQVKEMRSQGLLPPGFMPEQLFAKEPEIKPNKDSNNEKSEEIAISPEYIKGFYDKDTDEWVENPLYWQNIIIRKGKELGWTQEKIQKQISDKWQEIKEKAIQRLKQESERYKNEDQ